MTLLDLRHLAEWVSLVSLSGYACFLTFKGIVTGLDWLESRRQRRILQSKDDFGWPPQRRASDRVRSDARSRQVFEAIARGR